MQAQKYVRSATRAGPSPCRGRVALDLAAPRVAIDGRSELLLSVVLAALGTGSTGTQVYLVHNHGLHRPPNISHDSFPDSILCLSPCSTSSPAVSVSFHHRLRLHISLPRPALLYPCLSLHM